MKSSKNTKKSGGGDSGAAADPGQALIRQSFEPYSLTHHP